MCKWHKIRKSYLIYIQLLYSPTLFCTEFLQFALNQEEMRQKWSASVQECQRLHSALDKAHQELAALDRKLRHARRNLEEESNKRRVVEEQRDLLVIEIYLGQIYIYIYIYIYYAKKKFFII